MNSVDSEVSVPDRAGTDDAPVRSAMENKLISVATRLFAERGFDRTSVADIVKAAGVTKGAVYHYFSSKDELLADVYTKVLSMQMSRLESIAGSGNGPVETLREAAVDVALTSIHNIEETQIFWQSMHQLGEEQQADVRARRRRYHELFRSLVTAGCESGALRDDIDPDLVLDYFFGAVHHVTTWYRSDGPLSADDVARDFGELLMSSLRPPAASKDS